MYGDKMTCEAYLNKYNKDPINYLFERCTWESTSQGGRTDLIYKECLNKYKNIKLNIQSRDILQKAHPKVKELI